MSSRVLIVDDETSILNILDIMLTREGFDVVTASSAERALEILTENNFEFDLIITDVVMPKMNGYQLGNEILKVKEEMPIIFISGFNSSKELTVLISANSNLTYQSKPFGIDDIKKRMSEVL